MPNLAPNWQEAREFLELIAGERDPKITFQVFDDAPENPNYELAAWRYGRLSDPKIRSWLVEKQRQRCGVYYTLNKCNGSGRRRKHVVEGTTTGVDFDGTELPPSFAVEPEIINETSPGRFHVLWLLQPEKDLNAWSDCQARMAHYYGGDPAVFDPPRVFRLPGFWHQKEKPFRVHTIRKCDFADAQLSRHDRAELAAAHECDYTPPFQRKESGRSDEPVAGWDHPEDIEAARERLSNADKPAPGNRNNAAYRMAAVLNDYAISPEKSLDLLGEWNETLDVPLPIGEIQHVIRSAPEYKGSSPGIKSAAANTIEAQEDFTDPVDLDAIMVPGDNPKVIDWPPALPKTKTKIPDWPPPGDKPPTRIGGLEWQVASDITPDSIKWLWPNRIPRGKVSMIGGFPNQGKSQLLCNMAAIITTGGEWPNGEGFCEKGAVVILAAEDTAKDMLIPRLMAAGADIDQVLIVSAMVTYKQEGKIKQRVLNIEDDLAKITTMINHELEKNKRTVRAVFLDPMNAYYGSGKDVDSHNASEMRALLTPLSKWCGDKDIAVIGISHFNKGNNTHILYRITDSAAITAVCRAVWYAVQNEEDERYYFVEGKKNVGKKSDGLEYEIDDRDIEKIDSEGKMIRAPFVRWLRETQLQAHEILGMKREGDASARDECVEIIMRMAKKPIARADLLEECKLYGVSDGTLRTALRKMNLRPDRRGFPSAPWYCVEWVKGDKSTEQAKADFEAD